MKITQWQTTEIEGQIAMWVLEGKKKKNQQMENPI